MKLVVDDRRRWVLPQLLRERARELEDKPFLSFAVDDASVTYAQADELSDRLAAGLATLGVSRGDRVAVMMGNRLEFVLTWFALNKLGAFHAPINTDYRGDFLEHLVNTAGANLMVLEHRFVKTVLASESRMPMLEELIVVGGEAPASTGRLAARPFASVPSAEEPPEILITPADTYAVLFTSGTTGRSKGALMPYAHGHLLNERNLELLDLNPEGVYISELPLFHINAHMTVYGSLIVGASARMEERFSASRWLDRLRTSGATHSSMLGVMVDFVLRQPPTEHDQDHALRSVWMVPCLPDLSRRFRDRFGIERIVTSYGTSEIGMVARRVVDRSENVSSGKVGEEFYEVQIVDEDDEPLPQGRGRRDRRPHEVPVDRHPRLLRDAGTHDRGVPEPVAAHRRRGAVRRGGQPLLRRSPGRPATPARREHRLGRCRACARHPCRRGRGRGRGRERRRGGRRGRDQGVPGAHRGRRPSTPRPSGSGATSASRTSRSRGTWRCTTRCRRRRPRR